MVDSGDGFVLVCWGLFDGEGDIVGIGGMCGRTQYFRGWCVGEMAIVK